MTLRAREEEYKAQIAQLTNRVHELEEEMQSRLIDSEDVHQMSQQYAQERRGFLDRLAQLD